MEVSGKLQALASLIPGNPLQEKEKKLVDSRVGLDVPENQKNPFLLPRFH